MAVFKIPRKIEDLGKERPGQLCAPDPAYNDPEEACERCIAKLEQASLGIVNDQEAFECAFVAVSNLVKLPAPELVKQLTVAMCKNLHAVATSGLQELGQHQYEKSNPAVVEHLSAVQAYTFFLSQVMAHSHISLVEALKADAQQKGAPKKGRGKAKEAAEDGEGGAAELWWDVMGRIARVLVSLLRSDLDGVLYRVPAEKSGLLNLVVQAAGRCLSDAGVMKQQKLLGWCNDTLLLVATKHSNCTDAIEFVSSCLAELWKNHEHGPEVAVALAAAAAKAGGNAPTRLGKALVGKFCEVSPEAYDEAAKRDVAPVRRAAQLLASMAEVVPEVIHDKLSQLVNYFGCQSADTIRKHLVDCMGSLFRYYMGRKSSEAGNLALITSRTNTGQLLLQRANDKSASVRKAVLNTITELVECGMWGHDVLERTAEVAISRLEDGSLVVGAALELLMRLVERHSSLQDDRRPLLAEGLLMETITKYEAQLAGMEPDDLGPDGEEDGGAKAAMWEQGGVMDAAATQSQAGIIEPTQIDADAAGTTAAAGAAAARSGLTYSEIKQLLAILNAELGLARQLTAALPEVESQLASDSAAVTESAIKLLTLLRKVQLEGVEDAWRRVWHMVFSKNEKVQTTVCDAFNTMISPEIEPKDLKKRQRERTKRLLPMLGGLDQRDMQALEELLRLAIERGDIKEGTTRQAIQDLSRQIKMAAMLTNEGLVEACADARRLSLLCAMLTRHVPGDVVPEAGEVVGMLNTSHIVLKDAVLVRDLAVILGELAAPPHRTLQTRGAPAAAPLFFSDALANLYSVLLSNYLPEAGGGWAAAAQAAIGAIYAMYPEPHVLMEPLLKELAEMIRAGSGRCPAVLLTRAVFIVGCVATQQLALVDKLAKQVRKERTDREKAAAAAGSSKKGGEDDMDAQLGTGQARDAALDALQEELEAAILRPGAGLVAEWGGLVSGLCHRPDLLTADVALAAAALGALCKLMALDTGYCDANCSVFFTRLTGRGAVKLPTDVRCSMLVTLGDLGRRHPNVVEPWTVRMFECLRDEPGEEEVARTCLRILSHLILSDMTKPKGHMAQVARCMVARDSVVKDLALRLFNSLAAKQAKGGKNQVLQYLPEIISDATRGQPMAEQDFNTMMRRLLGYIKQDKLTEQIKVRLVERMENVVVGTPTAAAAAPSATQAAASSASQSAPSTSQPAASAAAMSTDAGGATNSAADAASSEGTSGSGSAMAHLEAAVREWRGITACLNMVPYSEKGLRMIMERFKCYKHTLADEQVYKVFKGIAEHGRKGNRSPELKQEVAEYEARLEEAHNTLREEQLAYKAKLEAERAAAEAEAAAAAAAAAETETPAEAEAPGPQAVEEEADDEAEAASQEGGDAEQMEVDVLPEQESTPAPGVNAPTPGGQPKASVAEPTVAPEADEEGEEGVGEAEDDDQTEAPGSEDAEAEEGEEFADCDDGAGEGEEADAMDMDVDMEDSEWQEAREEASGVSTPPSRRGSALASGAGAAGRDDTATSAPTPLLQGAAAGTPMAITPAPGVDEQSAGGWPCENIYAMYKPHV